jgi:hypothetical protein
MFRNTYFKILTFFSKNYFGRGRAIDRALGFKTQGKGSNPAWKQNGINLKKILTIFPSRHSVLVILPEKENTAF